MARSASRVTSETRIITMNAAGAEMIAGWLKGMIGVAFPRI